MASNGDNKWLDDFAKTPEGKAVVFGFAILAAPTLLPTGIIALPLMAGGLLVHGIRKLVEK